jgi:hypothetical protein
MSISSKASKLLTNKYVLYIVLFLAVTTVFGYMSMNDTNSVIFFAMVSLIISVFTRNMIVVLGLSVLFTNLLAVTKGKSQTYKEGLENKDDNESKNESKDNQNTNTKPKPKPAPVPVPKGTQAPLSTSQNVPSQPFAQPATETMESMKLDSSNKKGSKNRIDYASTLEEAYDNLDSILGGDGIKNLTKDTQKLMSKQQELFKSMETMAPMLNQAKSMLEGFDMKNLQGLASLATNFGSTPTSEKEKEKQ